MVAAAGTTQQTLGAGYQATVFDIGVDYALNPNLHLPGSVILVAVCGLMQCTGKRRAIPVLRLWLFFTLCPALINRS